MSTRINRNIAAATTLGSVPYIGIFWFASTHRAFTVTRAETPMPESVFNSRHACIVAEVAADVAVRRTQSNTASQV